MPSLLKIFRPVTQNTHIFLFCLADITLDALSVILSGSSLFVEVPVYVFPNKKGFKLFSQLYNVINFM